MKTIKFTAIAMGALLTITSCNDYPTTPKSVALAKTETPTKTEAPDHHTSKNSLDWAGTYTGTLPCADCEGIEATIVLNQDQTFEKTFVYQAKKDGTFNEKGKFTWNKEGNSITLDSKGNPSFRVKEDTIVMLDSDGNEITGALSNKYVLKKQ